MIRFIVPSIAPAPTWAPFLQEAYDKGIYSNFGPIVTQFEKALATRFCTKPRDVVSAASGTAGLTMALLALDLKGPVILPSFTFAATAQAVLQAQCTPVLCDVDPVTWELSPQTIRPALERTPRPVAILQVRAFGHCRDQGPVESLAKQYGLPLIIDAAAALGGKLPSGAWVGSQGDAEVFSLHATKALAAGEGGVVFARPGMQQRLRITANFGLHQGDVVCRGTNGKMSEFHGAVGLGSLGTLAKTTKIRQEVSDFYHRALGALRRYKPSESIGSPPWQTFPVLLPDEHTNIDVVTDAAKHGIELRAYYAPALHMTKTFGSQAHLPALPHAAHLARHMVCLPCYPALSHAELHTVASYLQRYLS